MSRKKSLLKTISWRIIASSTTLLLVYILSGEVKVAGIVASLDMILKLVLYYFHERAWENY